MEDYTNRAKHGNSAQKSIEGILTRYVELGYIQKVCKNIGLGRKGFKNTKQFYAPFLIAFDDKTEWVLFTTTSMRTDRIKGQQWDALNLKEIDDHISHVYLVYPDEVSDKDRAEFVRQNRKYENNTEYSIIEAIVSQEQVSTMIEAYALRNKSEGQIKDAQGNDFENRVASILSYKLNFEKWKNDDQSLAGMHYDMYLKILKCFALNKSSVSKIEATADKKRIGKLASGGNPKTDILVLVTDEKNAIHNYTISCKRTSGQSVSVHQYEANAFADVLDENNQTLRALLLEFQRCGSLEQFGKDNEKALTIEMRPYLRKFVLWVLSGKFGKGSSAIQEADYILTYDNNLGSAHIMEIEKYADRLLSGEVRGNFGTPFSWTYPSKRRGKDIQLKCKIIQ